MNPNSNPKRSTISWVLLCVASFLMTASAFGQTTVVNQGGPITVNDNSAATPYPSTNQVAATFGTLEKLTVTLFSVSHGYPDDVDAILEGPDGTKTMLFSDAGGQFDLVNTTFTLDPASSLLPDEGQIVAGGVYNPFNFNGTDADQFPAPANGTPLTSFSGGAFSALPADLTAFVGKSGSAVNGTWNLYVIDDTVNDSGVIPSWALNLYMSPILGVDNSAAISVTEDSPKTINLLVNDSDSPLSSLTLTAHSLSPTIIPDSGLTFGGNTGGTNRTLTISPAANANGGPVTITITAKDAQGGVFAGVNQQTITVNVSPVNDAPTMIVGTASTSIQQGSISSNIVIHLRDIDSPASAVVLTATSSNPSVIPATNVLFRTLPSANPGQDDGTNRVVQIAAGALTGSATITIIATDNANPTASSSNVISVTVTGNPHVVAANPATIIVPDNAAATPYPSTITVPASANLGTIGKVVVSLINVRHPNPSDLGVLLVSPSGTKLILMRGVGDSLPVGGQVNDARLSFDVDATTFLGTPITTSTNQALDLGLGPFPGVPGGTFSGSLAAFQGEPAAGTWSLYVYDTTANGSAGQIAGGWSLEIYAAPVIGAIANASTPEDTSLTVPFTVVDLDGFVTNVVASSSDQLIVPNPPNVGNTAGLTAGSFTFSPAANANGPVTITLTATDNQNYTSTRQFTLNVTRVNDAPTQTVIPKQVARAGQSVGPISFTVNDLETAPGNLTVSASSNNPKLLPPGSIILGGSGANRTITIFPAGALGGTADITVTVTDTGDGVNPPTSSSQTFDLTVNEAANPLFENVTGINIIDPVAPATAAAASPYPSVINVSGLVGTIAEVQVTLFGITHPSPDDIDVMLVGPGAAPVSVVIMSDVGGGAATPLNNVTLRFRQSATDLLPDSTQIVSGDYKPTDFEFADFPAFGSPANNATSLDAFAGTNPNGDWKLYVVDDTAGPRGGVISSWQLSIRTRPNLAAIPDQTTLEDTPLRLTLTAGDNQPGVPLTVSATVGTTANTPSQIIASINTPTGENILTGTRTVTGGNQTFTITPLDDASGTNSVTITFADAQNNTTSRTFNFIVTAVNDPPRFGSVSDKTTPSATPISFTFTVFDPEGKAVNIVATSDNQSIVADNGITVAPGSATATSANDPAATRNITVTPAGVASGQATITLVATDADGQKSTKSFVVSVTPNVSFLSTDPITITDNAPATPYPSVINVSGVNGTVSGASVILVGFSHVFPDDVDILLVAPDGRSVMLMSDAGGGNPVSNLRLAFSDSGSGPVPDQTTLTSQLYKPANYNTDPLEIGEMPSPAPVAPPGGYSTTLGSLAGVNPNGPWKLYVRDDQFPDGGTISGGWILQIQTAPTISQIQTQTTQEDTPLPVRFTVSDQDTPVTGLTITTSVQGSGTGFNDPGLIPNANLTLVTNSSSFPDVSYTLTILPATNQPATKTSATNQVTITATDAQGNAATSKFLVVVTSVDDPPQIIGAITGLAAPNDTTNRVVTAEDTTKTIQWLVKDVDSVIGTSTNIIIQSSNPTLVPNVAANIVITGNNDNPAGTTFTVQADVKPAANQTGTTVLSIIVADRSQTSTNQVTLEVTPVNDLPTIVFPSLDANTPSVSVGVGSSVTIPITVGDIETGAQDLVVTATAPAGSQGTIPNANLVIGGRGADRTLTITPAGSPANNITITVSATDGNSGTTTKSFNLNVTPPPGQSFVSTGTISIPAAGTSTGPASPYPSTIVVPGTVIGNITKVSVTIDGLSHTAPDDIDMLLVSPAGTKVLLMSDAGGRTPISNVQLVFNTNGRALPDESAITSGTYQSTDYEPGSDVFPNAAPAGPYTSSLSDLIGTYPVGTWSLYIVDDASSDVGQLTSWTLSIETGPSVQLVSGLNQGTFARINEDSPLGLSFMINDPVTAPTDLSVSYSSTGPGLLIVTNSTSLGAGNAKTFNVTVTPQTNSFGTNNLIIVVRRSDGAQSSLTVPLDIVPQNDPAIISRLVDRTTSADTPLTVPLAITDVDTALNRLVISGSTPGNQSIIPSVNVLIGGKTNVLKGVTADSSSVAAFPSGTLDTWTGSLVIVPAPAAFGGPVPVTITVQEVDANGNNVGAPVSSTFNVTVTPINHAPTIAGAGSNPLPTLIAVEAGKSTTNIVFTVADADNDNVTITGSSDNQSLVRDADVVILSGDGSTVLTGVSAPPGAVGSNGGNRLVRVSTQPGVTGDATITLRASDPSGGRGVATFIVRLTPTRERVFANATPITIRDNNSGNPYPSQISVTGFSGAVSKVTVSLNGFWHTFPDDVDIALVSPSGKISYIVSDAGGGGAVPSNGAINLKFDDTDSAAIPVPDNGQLISRIYSVANYEAATSDDFANRTPAGPVVSSQTPAALSTFVGENPNGVWSLYVVDDTPSDSGAITNGWTIGITTLPRFVGLGDVTSPEDVAARVPFTIAEESFANPGAYTFTVASSNPALVPSSANNIVVTGDGTNRVVTIIPNANANTNNAGGTATITLTEQTTGVASSFKVSFTPVNDAPAIAQVPDQTVAAGTFVSVPGFNISDVETARKDLTNIVITSSDPTIIRPQDVHISGTDLLIFAGTQVGKARITIAVTDKNTDGLNPEQTSSMSFNVTVAAGFNTVVSSTTPITIVDNSRANPYPSSLVVSNVNGTVNKVTVTLTGLTHPFPDDVDVLLVGPNGQGVVLMSDAGAGGSPQTALSDTWLIFDDASADSLPDAAPITPFHTYKPTNFEVSNTEFLSPAPQGAYAATLNAAFQGINPNGTWSLYVQDDASPDAGSLQGWILNIALNEVGPTLTGLADTTTNEDSFVTIPFTVGSATLDAVTFVTSASNSNLVTSIKVGGSGADRVLQISLAPDSVGTSQITVAATDATGTRTRQLLLTVNPVNDAPVFAALPDIRITGPTTVTLNVTDVDTPLNQLTFFGSTASVGLISDVSFSVAGSTVTALITPTANASGTDRLTLSVSDGTSTVKQSFNVTVVPPGPPQLDAIADVTTSVNRPVTVALTVNDSDTLIQDLTFFASESDSLISDVRFELVSSNSVAMTITPAQDKTGGTRVTVTVSDGANTSSQSFNLTVTSAGPVLGPIANQDIPVNGTKTIALVVSDPDTPTSGLTFLASTSNPDLIKDVTFISVGTNVSATISLVANASGSGTVTITVSDGTSTASQTFTVNVAKPCQPPVIAAIANQTASGTSFTLNIPVTDADDPLTNLTFFASAAGNVVSGATFAVANGVVTGTFTLSGTAGTESVTVTASDGCGSGKQTFDVTVNTGGGVPAVLTVGKSGTNLVLTVTGTAGASYVIERTTDLKTWSVYDTITIPAGGSAQITIPANVGRGFFRVRAGAGALATQKTALFVVSNTTLVAGDLAVSNRLVSLGYSVTSKAAPATTAADATGMNIVVVSSTITSGDVGGKFLTSNVPVVHWEQAIQDDFLMTGNTDGTDRGTTTADQTQLNILATSHPLAAGLSAGLHTVSTSPTTFSWGTPQGTNVIKIATVANNTNQVALYGYDAGVTITGTNKTAARRVFLFMQDPGLTPLSAEGLQLFDAAINWAGSTDVTRPGDAIVLVNGTDDGDGTINTGGLNPPGAEGVEHVIDNAGQKYLNFLDLNSGFIVTPSIGRTLVTGIRLWTANDSEPRDPASYKIEGSSNGPNGPWTIISEGALALPAARNAGGVTTALTGSAYQDVNFSNAAAYTSYRVTFPTIKGTAPAAANSMQIAEVDLYGYSK